MLSSPAWPPSATAVDTDLVRRLTREAVAAPATRLALAGTLATDATARPGRQPGTGTFGARIAMLAAVARTDVTAARVLEPHLDALGILGEAGVQIDPDTAWGVFAAEAAGTRLTATADGADGSTFLLTGRKPWCSLASTLTHALVTAHTEEGRRLFAVDLRSAGVTTHDDVWIARGMPGVPSGPVDFDAVQAVPVGAAGWYLARPGFAWGGIGVAACWWGGAVGLAAVLAAHALAHPESELLQHAVGATVLDLADAEDALAGATAVIDGTVLTAAPDWRLLAQVVRSRVRASAEAVRSRVVSTLGPAPLTSDAAYAARVADLELYLLQDHGDRDVARVGRLALEGGRLPW